MCRWRSGTYEYSVRVDQSLCPLVCARAVRSGSKPSCKRSRDAASLNLSSNKDATAHRQNRQGRQTHQPPKSPSFENAHLLTDLRFALCSNRSGNIPGPVRRPRHTGRGPVNAAAAAAWQPCSALRCIRGLVPPYGGQPRPQFASPSMAAMHHITPGPRSPFPNPIGNTTAAHIVATACFSSSLSSSSSTPPPPTGPSGSSLRAGPLAKDRTRALPLCLHVH